MGTHFKYVKLFSSRKTDKHGTLKKRTYYKCKNVINILINSKLKPLSSFSSSTSPCRWAVLNVTLRELAAYNYSENGFLGVCKSQNVCVL